MDVKQDLLTRALPIAISLLALIVSAFSLGWNIYRDVILKPRLRVHLSASKIIGGGLPKPVDTLVLEGTNFGPGAMTCTSIVLKTKHAVLIHDFKNPLSAQLPKKLEVGEKLTLLIPWRQDCFLSTDMTHIGLSDTFGRLHWAPRSDVERAGAEYKKEFGDGKKDETASG
jgi:hypothetical protein